ncbi:Pfam:DUF3468 [Geosmithia morbida]|uniref:Pfam:DUF3468 n=1 Tax=Geosmithia morbida TaxID=1094350 RepID=A0A9P4YT02_9HYPO|nr:Pfam:DUF3468 [Geosmithia morbida]KAF4122235.1 Pfam:DUF3468 [Geosmithia morbida]
MARVRVVEGSCWPCKKRRTRCDLVKPVCQRCVKIGAKCDYNSRLIRWSSRPSVRHVPSPYQVPGLGQDGLIFSEKLALDYFHCRVWPLLQTSESPCPPPLPVALEYRVVLLSACVLAGSHRLSQNGEVDRHRFNAKRLECLTAIKSEVDGCCDGSRSGSLLVLLFAVLLLYLHDGFMDPNQEGSSTASHHRGVAAILSELGEVDRVLVSAPESLQMLLSEFVSADLTTALLHGKAPLYPPSIWHTVDQGAVWWARDPWNRQSIASVLRELSALAFYYSSIRDGSAHLSMDEVRAFEEVLRPAYASLAKHTDSEDKALVKRNIEAVHAFALIRAFQHTGLIYLYRAICGLPILHPLVQQHVRSCLDCILEIPRPNKVLNCAIFPLCVAGAHAHLREQQEVFLELLGFLYDNMRFASVRSVTRALESIWGSQNLMATWAEMFFDLSHHVIVL